MCFPVDFPRSLNGQIWLIFNFDANILECGTAGFISCNSFGFWGDSIGLRWMNLDVTSSWIRISYAGFGRSPRVYCLIWKTGGWRLRRVPVLEIFETIAEFGNGWMSSRMDWLAPRGGPNVASPEKRFRRGRPGPREKVAESRRSGGSGICPP